MAAIKYTFPSPAELPQYIDTQVVPRLNAVACKTGGVISNDYVINMLIKGAFSLGIFSKEDKIIGIAIQQEVVDALTGAVGMHVVCMHIDKAHDSMVEIANIMDRLAECFQYAFISMNSTRRGWARKSCPGWAQQFVSWGKHYVRR